MEAIHDDITLNTGTDYPCTQEELNASGGANRRMGLSKTIHKRELFKNLNEGPFVSARKAVREVFDHNRPQRTPSAEENDAIVRLSNAIQRAAHERWGPDLVIKAFCDLDRVFFRARLRGHVCLTWKPNESFRGVSFAETTAVSRHGKGKCVIHLNAMGVFLQPECESVFEEMFATLLHEMCHVYQRLRTGCKEKYHHGKNFGTMMFAVDRRAGELFGLNGHSNQYPRHDYARNEKHRPVTKRPPSRIPPPLPLGDQTRPAPSSKSGHGLYDKAFEAVTLDSGIDYDCTQSDRVFFRGDLRGHVCVRWLRSSRSESGYTILLGEGKCAIRMNARTILRKHLDPLRQMFAIMLHEMCHAHALIRVRDHAPEELEVHGKDFGTSFYAVDSKARSLLGLSLISFEGEAYPRH